MKTILFGLAAFFVIASIAIPLEVYAQTSTPVPTPTHTPRPSLTPLPTTTLSSSGYTRDELLTRIAPIPVNATAAFQGLNLPNVSVVTIAQGFGIGETFNQMLRSAGVYAFITGIIVMMMIIYWIRKNLMQSMNKRQISPYEKEFVKFRREFKSFRGTFRTKRRR